MKHTDILVIKDVYKRQDMIFLMRPPLVGAHEPFSTKATVLFWIL